MSLLEYEQRLRELQRDYRLGYLTEKQYIAKCNRLGNTRIKGIGKWHRKSQ